MTIVTGKMGKAARRQADRPAAHPRLAGMALLAALGCAGAAAADGSDGVSQAMAGQGQALESDAAAMRELQRDVQAYRRAIDALEQESGAFAPGLSEQLLGLGLALQRNGDHLGAIEAFKRGAHLSRINEGLYSPRQVALLRGEIESHVALGELEDADERQRYLYRVEVRTLSDRPRGEALMEHALWQRQAFEAGLGEVPAQRLLRMYSLHRLALTEIAEAEGRESRALLPPLYGMLRAQYLLTGFVGETTSGRFQTRMSAELESQQVAISSSAYKEGAAVIRAIYDVRRALENAPLADTAEAMLMLGDWQLWTGKRDDAMATYSELERELAAVESAQALREAYFAQPQALPSLAGVRALPDPSEDAEGALLLEFGVNERGRVVDLKRLDENPAIDDKADKIMRRFRQVLFRPRISDGFPVATERVVVAYDPDNW
jgi:hypothetical protein